MPPPDQTWDAAASGPVGSGPPPGSGPTPPAGSGPPARGAEGPRTSAPRVATSPPEAGDDTGPDTSDDARYARDGVLGRGGMGVVYLARDQRLDRLVALKEAAREGETAVRLARESRLTAGLDHPGIVTVHDSGITAAGLPFYTMRLLRGRPLSALLAERPALADRLGLLRHFLSACEAVAYAHAEGVVHRDLKPANIMVGGFGETQVVDWGLATRLGGAGSTGPTVSDPGPVETREGAVLGTPAYMSPEQARGERAGTASDVWSLGAVLYELLAGQHPRGAGSSAEVLARARAGAVPSLRDLAGVPPELAAVAERALARDPAARYPDAGALAVDVAAWLDGRPVAAHRYTSWELLRRLVRAWRAPLAVGAAALLVLAALASAAAWRLAEERDRVVAAEREARRALATSDTNLAQSLVAHARTRMVDGAHAVAAVLASRAVALSDTPEARGVLAGVALAARAERGAAVTVPACAQLVVLGLGDVVCVEAQSVTRVRDGQALWRWSGTAGATRLEGDRLRVGTEAGYSVALNLDTGEASPPVHTFILHGSPPWPLRPADWPPADAEALPFQVLATVCPGSDTLALGTDGPDPAYAVLCGDGRVGAGRAGGSPTLRPTDITREALAGVVATARTTDGKLLVSGVRGTLALLDPATGAVRRTEARTTAWRFALSPDGRRFVTVDERGKVEVRELPGLELVVTIPGAARAVAFEPDGSLLIAGATELVRWHLPASSAATVVTGPDGLTAAVFSPDGRVLATAHGRDEASLWDLPAGRRAAALPLGNGTAKAVSFLPDSTGAWFATVGPGAGDWAPVLVRRDGRPPFPLPVALRPQVDSRSRAAATRRIVALPDGAVFALGYSGMEQFAFDLDGGALLGLEGCGGVEWADIGQTSAASQVALVGSDGTLARLRPGRPLRCERVGPVGASSALSVAAAPRAVDVAADGSFVVGCADAVLRLGPDGVEQWRVGWGGAGLLDVSVSDDGRWVAAGGTDRLARVWDDTGRLRAVLAGHTERVASVDVRHDGRVLATGSWDATARLWGLDALDLPAATVEQEAARTWGLTVEEALASAER